MKKYDFEKYSRMIKKKQLVYTHQLKRLSKSDKRANFVLIYYSIMLIIYSLSLKFFLNHLCANLMDFFNIVLSMIVLIYSIINSNSRYSERVRAVEHALSRIKNLKRRLADANEITIPKEKEEEFKKIKEDYEHLINHVEYRYDLDFYYAVLNLCKYYNINSKNGGMLKDKQGKIIPPNNSISESELHEIQDEIKVYLAEINLSTQKFNIFIHKIWHIILYLTPIIIYLLCFIFK